MVCWAAGDGLCRRDDFGADVDGEGFGGVCGRIGTARPTSVCPRALSTFGRLKRLKSDIFEADRSSFGGFGVGEGSGRIEVARDSESRGMVEVRPNRHREVEGGSCTRLRILSAGAFCSPGPLYVARYICEDDRAMVSCLATWSQQREVDYQAAKLGVANVFGSWLGVGAGPRKLVVQRFVLPVLGNGRVVLAAWTGKRFTVGGTYVSGENGAQSILAHSTGQRWSRWWWDRGQRAWSAGKMCQRAWYSQPAIEETDTTLKREDRTWAPDGQWLQLSRQQTEADASETVDNTDRVVECRGDGGEH
jgi:hypothetical protein